ncbi:YacL family protein [Colwellia sp. UCD-KL20]|uniref:UPF0231 family protein n=1 Tax=Colwellia sp. UCD-KL20 TaxID=1917165 RepID=UPI0009710764|nr:YacL family protein [Colwellia sp. UCD-KL20]
MEYEFIHDSLTGAASARFSMEHEIMGPWLEVEVGKNIEKINILLEVVDNIKERQQKDITITGMEYSLIFSEDSVQVFFNRDLEEVERAYDSEIEQGINTDYDSSTECGVEDFRELLIKWSNFIK